MRGPPRRNPVEWRQLCAIARAEITAAPTIDDAEWKERIKDRIVALELNYPEQPELLTRAMSAVEKALEKQWGPRPSSLPPPTDLPVDQPPQNPPWSLPRRTSTDFTSVAEVVKSLQASSNSATSSKNLSAEEHEAMVRQQIADWRQLEARSSARIPTRVRGRHRAFTEAGKVTR